MMKKIGNFIFKEQAQDQPEFKYMIEQMPIEIVKILHDESWKIYHYYAFQLQFSYQNLLKYIKECTAQKVEICNFLFVPQSVNYLKLIQNVSFSNLKSLIINGPIKFNIQGIAFINCPLIKNIYLQNNQISILKPLNKVKWVFLQDLNIKGLRCPDLKVQRIKFNKSCIILHNSIIDPFYDIGKICRIQKKENKGIKFEKKNKQQCIQQQKVKLKLKQICKKIKLQIN